MASRSALLLALAAFAAAQDPGAARVDLTALVRHYAAVEAELLAAPVPADPVVAGRRLAAIAALRAYRERGIFGQDRWDGSRSPRFVDDAGRRCAVGWLLDCTGQGELTVAIARQHNQAWVAELGGVPGLAAWLHENGLT
ncbi:MAG: hypothetical protein WBO45_08915, partial [Planctomycetota bacterium]